MADFVVNPAQLEALAASIARAAAEIRDRHDALRRELDPLYGPDWLGVAAEQFRGLYDRYDRYACGMVSALDGIGRLLRRAGTAYAQIDAEVAAAFR